MNVANPDAVPAGAEFRLPVLDRPDHLELPRRRSGPGTVNNSTVGLHVSPYISIDNAAKSDVYIRLVGVNGDGSRDPEFGKIDLQVR